MIGRKFSWKEETVLKGSLANESGSRVTSRWQRASAAGLLAVAAVALGCKQAEPGGDSPATTAVAAPATGEADTKATSAVEAAKAPDGEGTPAAPPTAEDIARAPGAGSAETGAVATAAPPQVTPGQAAEPPAAGKAAIQGAVVKGEGFDAYLRTAGKATAGKATTIEVVLNAHAPFKCNEKYPYKFKLNAAPGVPEGTFREMSVHKQTSTLAFPVTLAAPGTATLSGTLSFSVCTDDKCLVDRAELSLAVPVEAAATP